MDIAKVETADLLQGGTSAEAKKLSHSDSGVICTLNHSLVSIDSNPAAQAPQTATPSDPAQYVLDGPTWSIDIESYPMIGKQQKRITSKQQLAMLTRIQQLLGGKLLFNPKA